MAHIRQQIREAAAEDLLGLRTTGEKVRRSAVWPIGKGGLPCLLVYVNNETVEFPSMRGDEADGRRQLRTLSLSVEGAAEGSEATLDNTLEQIGVEVERALVVAADSESSNLGPLVLDLRLSEVELSFGREGRRPSVVIKITFEAAYQARE